MSKYSIALLTAFTLSAALTTPLLAKDAKDQGFAGKWLLDKKTSHGSEPMGELRQDIKQNGSDFTVQSRFAEPPSGIAPLVYLGIMTSTLILKTDGQEIKNQIGPFMFVSKTTVDGNKMITDWGSTLNGDPVEGKWVRTLSDDGKRLTLEITQSSTKGQKGDATLNFNRK